MPARKEQEAPQNISKECQVVAEVLKQKSLLKPIPGVLKISNYES